MRHWDGTPRRRLVEETTKIDIRAWQRRKMLSPPGRSFAHGWTSGARIGVRVGREAVTLVWAGEDGGQVDQSVKLRRLRKVVRNRIGYRAFFVCGGCGRGCEVLYPGAGRWNCRRCCGLAYRSELELVSQRGTLKAIRVQSRLGGATDGVTDCPPKPRRMSEDTYRRLVSEHWKARARLKGAPGRRQLLRYWMTGRGRC
jgi:hypothetical protein